MQTQPGSGSEEERLARARRRLAALKGFYLHLFIFAVVLAALTIINAAVGGPWWVLWVLLGWGIGLLAHGLAVLSQGSRVIRDWEERKLRQYLNER
jgi:hypothetical protein